MVVLEVDVGNTRLKWRLCSAGAVLMRGALLRAEFESDTELLRQLKLALQGQRPQQILVGSVAAEEVAAAIASWAAAEFALAADFAYVTSSCAGVLVGYDEPQRLGVDRWLAVLAASAYALDGVVVVDCGSAITIDVLRSKQHQGGYIVPGLGLMNAALFKDTARVKVAAFCRTDGAPGRNTSDAVNSGLPLMVVGLVHEVLLRLAGTGWWRKSFSAQVLVTGGDAPLLMPMLQQLPGADGYGFELQPDLVLDGLALAATRRWPWV